MMNDTMRFFFLAFLFVLLFLSEKVQGQAVSWGDQGNGTYINPILNADYSDPDVIRVGDKYYMVCSDFHYIGMPVLESDDMVNWRIISQVYNRFDFPGWIIMKIMEEDLGRLLSVFMMVNFGFIFVHLEKD